MDKSTQGWVAHGGLIDSGVGRSLGHGLTVVRSRSGLLTRWTNRLRGGLLMAVRLAQGWVVHWVGDDEEWVGRVEWVGEDEGWVGRVPSPCLA